jgi:2-polyprenyl-3-methyl-5-hydroxy-6-metoxy-1,4-benzoquinol methylase
MIRKFTQRDGILVFDEAQDEKLSTYDSRHLEELLKAENNHFWLRTRRDKICAIFNRFVDKNSRILEVGGGTGFVAEKLIQLGYDVEISDCAANGMAYAKARGIKKLYQFDLFNPPFHEAFDVICLFDVLEHLNDEGCALEILKKMLKPGGMIILSVPAHSWLWSREDALAGHKRRYTKNQLRAVFQSSGLKPLYIRYFFKMLIPFLMMRTWIKKDTGKPVQADENVNLALPYIPNQFFYFLMKIELHVDWLLPNSMGGSLIGIAQKNR